MKPGWWNTALPKPHHGRDYLKGHPGESGTRRAILQEQGLDNRIVIITDGFHQYRASLLAKRAGLESESESAWTNPLYVPTYWVREWMALFQLLVLGHG
ncbi:MAG: ElyC/SanA/YdcF family protein [Ruminococcus sp.]